MKVKSTLICGVVFIVIATAVFLFLPSGKEFSPSGDSSGLIVGGNAIYVAEQAPGRSFSVAVTRWEKPGFVVIHEDANGAPGKILGVSSLLPAGETKNLSPITLSRSTRDTETVYAMLHFDNGDGSFDAKNDKPALDSVGGEPVMMVSAVSQDATEPGVVNP